MIWSIWNFFTKCIHRTPQNNVHFANSINRWSSFGSSVFHKNIHSKVPFKKNIHPKSGLKKTQKTSTIYNPQKKRCKKRCNKIPQETCFFLAGWEPKKKHKTQQPTKKTGTWSCEFVDFVSQKFCFQQNSGALTLEVTWSKSKAKASRGSAGWKAKGGSPNLVVEKKCESPVVILHIGNKIYILAYVFEKKHIGNIHIYI